jgi:hypothetical protein
MNFYNGQWLIKDFGKSWPSIRFEYVVCIFLLLGSTVTLGIDDDYVVCRCSKCYWEKGWCSPHIDFDINIQHPYKPLVVAIRKF